MNKVDVWMPLYIGDYLSSTSRLTTEQHGAYLLLIMDYWKNGPLPDDDVILAQICRMSADAWSNARSTIRAFFEQDGSTLKHGRIDSELIDAKAGKAKRTAKAMTAAAKRWGKDDPSNAPSNEQALLDECPSPSPSHMSTTDVVDSDAPKKPARFDPLSCDLPSCISSDAWRSWVAYRRGRKITCAEATIRGQIKNLSAWSSAGHSADSIIKASIDNGWQGLFEPKVTSATTTRPSTGRQAAISNYAAEAAAARGDHGIAKQAFTERDITGESARVA